MNYLAFCGYWFYGASTGTARASLFCSWGLFDSAPVVGITGTVLRIMTLMNQYAGGIFL